MNGNTGKCAQCGKDMKALKSTKRYCSDACKQAAFYVRNAKALMTEEVNQYGIIGIQEGFAPPRRIYSYLVTICASDFDSFPYYEEPADGMKQLQPDEAMELLFPITTPDNKEEVFHTVYSSGIYGSVKQCAMYYHEEYKQVIPINGVRWPDLITDLKQEVLQLKKELNGLSKIRQRYNQHQVITDNRNLQTTPKTKPFTVTKGHTRIREPTTNVQLFYLNTFE